MERSPETVSRFYQDSTEDNVANVRLCWSNTTV